MREIKFRAWDTTREMPMFYGDYLALKLAVDQPDSYQIMQSTGLKDKNGKEIYEGDIIAYYATGRSRPVKKETIQWEPSKLGFNLTRKPTVEIIGNIYENPELLENIA